MPIIVQGRASAALVARCRAIQAAFGPRAQTRKAMEADLKAIVELDHEEMMYNGTDRYGHPRAPLAESTLARHGRGSGPSLIPRRGASRFLTNCEVVWQATGKGFDALVKQFHDIVNARGESFVHYHLEGASRPGTRWVLPRRDVGGLSRKGWAFVKERWAEFVRDVARYGRKRGD